MMACPVCGHPMVVHDGDGYDEPYECSTDGCRCAWEIGLDGRPEFVINDDA